MLSPARCVSGSFLKRTQGMAWLLNERASHSAGTTLLQMQIVINNIINKYYTGSKKDLSTWGYIGDDAGSGKQRLVAG